MGDVERSQGRHVSVHVAGTGWCVATGPRLEVVGDMGFVRTWSGGRGAGLPGSGVSGLGHCRVAAFGVGGLLRLPNFFITISHCAWRRVISLSKATKKRSKESAFRTRAHKLTQRAVSTFLAPQKHGARQSHGCVKPSFSEHRYPHASPPVTEPAQGAPRAIRGQPTTKFVCIPNHVANPTKN